MLGLREIRSERSAVVVTRQMKRADPTSAQNIGELVAPSQDEKRYAGSAQKRQKEYSENASCRTQKDDPNRVHSS